MSYHLTRWGYLRAYETPPAPADPPGETTPPSEQSSPGGAQSGVFSRDDFDGFQRTVTEQIQSLNQRVDGFGQQIQEGFGWVRENLGTRPADDAVPDSASENPAETSIEVVDRPITPNKRARKRLNLGQIFR